MKHQFDKHDSFNQRNELDKSRRTLDDIFCIWMSA